MIMYKILCKHMHKKKIDASSAEEAIKFAMKTCPYESESFEVTKTDENKYNVNLRCTFSAIIETDNPDIAKREATKLCPFSCHHFELDKIEF